MREIPKNIIKNWIAIKQTRIDHKGQVVKNGSYNYKRLRSNLDYIVFDFTLDDLIKELEKENCALIHVHCDQCPLNFKGKTCRDMALKLKYELNFKLI